MISVLSITKIKEQDYLLVLLQVVLGSFFMAGLSQLSVPLDPIPITLQTLAVFLLAMGLGGKKAALALFLYLGEASVGLPVLGGWKSNVLWFFSPSAGYLIGFPFAALIVGFLLELRAYPTWTWTILAVCVGQLIIYVFGLIGLVYFLDLKQAWAVGIAPFIPGTFYKMGMAVTLYMVYRYLPIKFLSRF